RGHVAGSPVVSIAAVRDPPHDSETRSSSAWSPLAHPVFRALWLASCVSNVGTWMHDTSAAWLMTGLAPSPLMVSLMQTATSLPFFLLALPAGALGPALGGLLVAALGAGWVFLLNAASFLGVVVVLARWHREVPRARLPPEDVPGAMRAGVRYVRHSAPFRAVLARTAAFVVPAS